MAKIAILIDGGFLLKRLPQVNPDIVHGDAVALDRALGEFVKKHCQIEADLIGAGTAYSLIYRAFYYDAEPYANKAHYPISKRAFDYSKSDEAMFRRELFALLRRRANFAVRLGEVRLERSWIIKEHVQKELLTKIRTVDDLVDEDFVPGLRQKAVDMRLAIDIASLTLKKQVDTIVLVTGDSDFVPAAKLARREGVRILLDPLWRSVSSGLFEHIDGLRNGFSKPSKEDSDV